MENFVECDLVGECVIVLILLIDCNRAKPKKRTDANLDQSVEEDYDKKRVHLNTDKMAR